MTTSSVAIIVYLVNYFIHDLHGSYLKYCKTCDGEGCNTDVIGAPDEESVKCIRCSSTSYDSTCRLGTDDNLYECPPDEQSCYTEYIYGGKGPLYRRGCSPSDWCKRQSNLHGSNLKYCKTCDGEGCNTDVVGAPDAESVKCIRCSSTSYDSTCRLGTDDNLYECPADEQSCYTEYIYGGKGPLYRRGCSPSDWCKRQSNLHGSNLKYCKTCDGEGCNTDVIDAPDEESVKCIRCSSTSYDSTCRLGTDDNLYECPPDEQSCYTEYIYGGKGPLYRRGCSPSDWCKRQSNLHGSYLKYCKTCDGEGCNTDVIDAPDDSSIQCYSCSTENSDGDCRKGGINNNMVLCKSGIRQCGYFYVSTSASTNTWARECAEDSYCESKTKEYNSTLASCDTCSNDLCNTDEMRYL